MFFLTTACVVHRDSDLAALKMSGYEVHSGGNVEASKENYRKYWKQNLLSPIFAYKKQINYALTSMMLGIKAIGARHNWF